MSFKVERLLRLTVRTIRDDDRTIIRSRNYDFDDTSYEMSVEDEDEICKVEEYLRRDSVCAERSIKDWIDIIEKLVEPEIKNWVGSIFWWDYMTDNFRSKDTEFFEEKYVRSWKPPEDDYDEALVAALDLLDHPYPKKRIYQKNWDGWYDSIQKKLEVRVRLQEEHKKK